MKKNVFCVFTFTILNFIPFLSVPQCGVTARINVSGPSIFNPILSSDSTFLQPNWKKYAYQWTANDNLPSFPNSPDFYPAIDEVMFGFNKVCLTIWGTDTITGDSCSNSTCNIFQGASDISLASLEVLPGGSLTQAFRVNINPYPPNFSDFLLKFGDGDSLTGYILGPFTHTYPAAGDYTTTLIINGYTTTMPGSTYSTRVVHVNNGIPNIYFNSANEYLQCDSLQISVAAWPANSNGFVSFAKDQVTWENNIACQSLVPFKIPAFKTPGSKLMRSAIYDSTGSAAFNYDCILSDVCGIVPDTARGKVFSDLDADGILDSNETGIFNKFIRLSHYRTYTDSLGNYTLLKPNEDACFSLGNTSSYLITVPSYGSYCINQANQNYNFGVAVYSTYISGKVFIDYNQDSINNSGDDALVGTTIVAYNSTLAKSFYTSTDQYGNYQILVPSGNYTVTPIAYNLDSAYFYPDSILINSPSGGYYSNKNFAASSSALGANLGIYLSSDNSPRPGFNHYLNIHLVNSGIDSTFGTVVLNYDSNLFFDTIIPSGANVDTLNHIITWQTGFIKAARGKTFMLYSKVPLALPLGTQLSSFATVLPDGSIIENDSLNNSSYLQETVIGAVDPNDKLVSPAGADSSGTVHHNQRLHYRINFQNTGTASAINVIVQDAIDANLDINTFLMEGSSHPCTVFINDRTATWKFFNINLSDSNSSEPQSHGYVEYSILPVQGLPDGSVIENSASIYFDFNAPVQTNTVQNTLQTNIVSVTELKSPDNFFIYPVPSSEQLTILPGVNTGVETEISLVDLSGRIIKTIYKGNLQKGISKYVSLKEISDGIYFIKIKSHDLFFTTKIVKN